MKPEAESKQIANNLYQVTLVPPLPGFSNFIGAWVYKGESTFIVDVGPSVTATCLLEALEDLHVHHLDYILITHIHIDHAGAVGDISAHFPKTPIVCHKAGIPHLVDTSRLWKGTVKTLGDIGRAYGPIKPVPRDLLVDAEYFSSESVTPVITPGHSPHHVSFLSNEYLFAGETGGVYLCPSKGVEYLRPATPPRFFLDTCINSIDILLDTHPSTLCYGHHGITRNATDMLEKHRNQLYAWKEIIADEMDKFQGDDIVESCMKRLLKADSLLSGFFQMDTDVQEREKSFLANSIKGFLGYLDNGR